MGAIRGLHAARRAGGVICSNLEDTPKVAHCRVADEDIFRRMQEHSQGDMILEEDDGPYEKGDLSGVSIIRLVDRYLRRHFWPGFYRFG